MQNFFRGLQSTPFQQDIEKVTDGNQHEEDWGLIMKICDHVAMHEESAKEAMKVIRKRLQTNPTTSGWPTIGLTLTLLEALTKNCGRHFHLQIAQKDFLKDFQGVIALKNNPPVAIREKVLGMIQTWALAFRDDPDLKNVEQFYQECQQQGLEFPPAEPVNIIKAAVPATVTIDRRPEYSRSASQPASGTVPRQVRAVSDGSSQRTGREHTVLRQLTPEQIAKLRSELDVVQTNAQIFGEMLVTLQPGEEHPQDLDLLMELYKTCKQMQSRVVDLLSQVFIDDITVELLRHNDEFNNSFKTYENYMQEREKRVGPLQIPNTNRVSSLSPQNPLITSQSSTKTSSSIRNQDNIPALIKFDEESATLSTGLQNLDINPGSADTTPKPTAQQSTASVRTRTVSNNHDPESDVKEVEQWLNMQGKNENDDKSHQEENTNDAFDDFLDKRGSLNADEPVSEQQIHINLQQPLKQNESSNTNN